MSERLLNRSFCLILIVVVLGLVPGPAAAFHFPWDQGHDTFDPRGDNNATGPGNGGQCSLASPVEPATGNFLHSVPLLEISGVGPMLEITLLYNSRDMRRGPLGNGWVFSYDVGLVETTDGVQVFAICRRSDGVRSRFVRNPDGSYSSAPGVFSRLIKNPDSTYSLREKSGLVREFDARGRLTSIIDRNGNALTIDYDATGAPSAITDAAGRTVSLTKGPTGRVASMTDPAGRVFRFDYDLDGNLVAVTDPLGAVTTYSYDANDNLVAGVDPLGKPLFTASYDSLDRIVTHVERGVSWTYVYQPASNRTLKRDAFGNTWTLFYDDGQNLTRRIDPLGGTEIYLFDTQRNLVEFTDARGSKTTFVYDQRGNPVRITDALGNEQIFTYDPTYSLPTSLEDAMGNKAEFEYDPAGNLTKTIDPAGSETVFEYDPKGRVVRRVDALGNETTFSHDAFGNLASVTDPEGAVSTATFDVLGRVTSAQDAEGRVATYAYDLAERLVRLSDPAGGDTEFEYDAGGNLSSLTTPGGGVFRYSYDSFNRPIREANPLNEDRTFSYDVKGRLTTLARPGGATVTLEFDGLDRLVRRVAGGNTTTYSWDPADNLLAVSDNDSAVSFAYDALNRRLSTSTGPGGVQPATSIAYTYDANGARLSMTDPEGNVTGYAFDSLRRVTAITSPQAGTTSFSYDALSRRTSLVRSTGAATNYQYDGASRLLSLNHLSQPASFGFQYTYDAVGNRLEVADADGSHLYDYDDLFRLIAAVHPAGAGSVESYSYDAIGNRLASHLSTAYAYDAANRLLTDDTFDYSYDDSGNLVTKVERSTGATTVYSYDAEDQLVRIDLPGGGIAQYFYDGLGRRIEKTVDGVSTRYVYDGDDILFEYASDDSVTARYGHGPGIDEVLSVERGGESFFFEADALGSVRRVTTSSGVAATYSYDSFGRPLTTTGASVGPHRFQGREFDDESGLYYFRARYLDPETGRFLSEDPLRHSAGPNLYQFVGGNPLTGVDPYGLQEYPADFVGPLPPGATRSPVPTAPPGVDVNANIAESRKRNVANPLDALWFRNQVKNKGPWDYKQQGSQYQNFGNFNYGACGAAAGFSPQTLRREAGRAQQAAGTSKPQWGDPGWRLNPWGGTSPYGDDPVDRYWIDQGIKYYETNKQNP